MIDFQHNSCVLVGDIHGEPISFIEDLEMANKTIEDCDVVFLGDIGLGFYYFSYAVMDWRRNNDRETMNILDKWAEENNNDVWVLRGNHDDPKCYTKRFFSKFKRVNYLKDGEIINGKNGKTYLVVPGAISVDRIYREEGISYWLDEPIKENRYKRMRKRNIDGVFAHTGPTPPACFKSDFIKKMKSKDPALEGDIQIERGIVDDIITKFNIKNWYNGHFHLNKDFPYINDCVAHAIDINFPYNLYNVNG